jgi:D-alanyl-D-alanine carboxypeptidase
MSDKARRLGMTHTTFKNASGLPHPGQVTTARDMITLALHLQDDFPRHYRLFATRSFTYNKHTYRNHNGLLGSFQGTDGIKTGYTRPSGFNLVSSVRRGDRHVVGAVFGGASAGARNAEMRMLLSRALLKASPVKTRRSAPVLVAQPRPATRPQMQAAAATPVADAVARLPSHPMKQTIAALPTERAGMHPVQVALADPLIDMPAPALSITKVRSVSLTPRATPQEPVAEPSPALAATAMSEPAPGRGMPAPTLQQQPADLARAQAPRAQPIYRLKGPDVSAGTPAAPGGFEIQIGAYTSPAEAEFALAATRDRATDLLAGATPATAPIQKGNRRLYRARFAGFSASVATHTCLELRRRHIDCLVLQPE